MNTLDFDALQRFTTQAQKLQAIVADLQPFLKTIKELDGKPIVPADRLIRTSEAAQILGVSKSAIAHSSRQGSLHRFTSIPTGENFGCRK